ncbi:hypothetical protein DICVIV_08849 [Dictyocaulus viviparus]|uniref:Uncharacterized protein n=1 Tax=Dictyocaulus viviparus TaxID=29172 RepID=A0A0D8XKG5_DICVI|nr:hypothetical protein DICVIV_08849 [Dictyocaulus viviparus]
MLGKSNLTVVKEMACFMCCYLLCPPTPDSITRKMAFHPPRKGQNYTVHLYENTEIKIKNASKLIGKEFFIKPAQLTKSPSSDYSNLMRNIECFVARTILGSYLICVRCCPSRSDINDIREEVVIFSQPNASDLGEYLQPFYVNIPLMADVFETEVYAFDYSGFLLQTTPTTDALISFYMHALS